MQKFICTVLSLCLFIFSCTDTNPVSSGLENVSDSLRVEFNATKNTSEIFWSDGSPAQIEDFQLPLTAELQSLLAEYQSASEIAPIFTEEQLRRQKRAALEPRILSIMDRIDRLMGEKQGLDDDSEMEMSFTMSRAMTYSRKT